ncbi:carbonic anhydrase [Magnetococcales bacterium HHB-1]
MKSIKELISGFSLFKNNFFEKDPHLYRTLVTLGQKPRVAMVACSDSRVDPALVFQAEPGDIFSIRNVANLVPIYEEGTRNGAGAALEFAVCHLGVSNIVVCGHAQCAGIRTLLERDEAEEIAGDDFISSWTAMAVKAKGAVLAEGDSLSQAQKQRACEQGSILLSMENLMTYPWIRERVERKELKIHGWYFDIVEGQLSIYKKGKKKFVLAK